MHVIMTKYVMKCIKHAVYGMSQIAVCSDDESLGSINNTNKGATDECGTYCPLWTFK